MNTKIKLIFNSLHHVLCGVRLEEVGSCIGSGRLECTERERERERERITKRKMTSLVLVCMTTNWELDKGCRYYDVKETEVKQAKGWPCS